LQLKPHARASAPTHTTTPRSLGQNFLTDEAILAQIVAAAGVTANDVVLEVGPGTGNLTRFLVATGAQVIAVEKDDTLVERLRQEFAKTPNIELVHGDILRVGIPGILAQMQQRHEERRRAAAGGGGGDAQQEQQQQQQPEASTSGRGAADAAPAAWRQRGAGGAQRGSLKVVANLPYNITKEFLKATLPLGGVVSELSIMIQHEVAERLVDPTPGRPDYRSMSIFTHFYSSPKYRCGDASSVAVGAFACCSRMMSVAAAFRNYPIRAHSPTHPTHHHPPPLNRLRIPRQKYFPVPGVDGALVTFRLIPPAKRAVVPSERAFHSLVAKAFSERRKMMRNSMQPLYASQQVRAVGLVEGEGEGEAIARAVLLRAFERVAQQGR